MIKSLKISPVIFILLVIVIIIYGNSFSDLKNESTKNIIIQNKTRQKISDIISEKKLSSEFVNIKLFAKNNLDAVGSGLIKYVSKPSVLKIQKGILAELNSKKPQNINLEIPLADNSNIVLELTQQKIFSDNFKVYALTQNGKIPFNYSPGVYYDGIIKGKVNSIASISIFKDNVIGIISDEKGNYNLASVKSKNNNSDDYIYYSENDLEISNNFKCKVDDYSKKLTIPVKKNINVNTNDSRLPVNIYFVTDYQTYLDNNSDTIQVANFITGLFNSVHTIYQNEFLPIQVSELGIYAFADPYRNVNDAIQILIDFGANTQTFNGNLAHLLSTRTGDFGGISWIRTLGSQFNTGDSSGPYSFSNIDNNYLNFPVYSWTVTVVSHEMGHSFGSQHTHTCVWPVYSNGGIGAIDSCYANYSENIGICFPSNLTPGTWIPRIGTIMSYCHLTAPTGGIDLSKGFGPMPGDTIRLRYNQDSEFGPVVNSSEVPTEFLLFQNYPNPFNPVTTISYALPVNGFVTLKVYDMLGREISVLVNEFQNAGIYKSEFPNINNTFSQISSGIYFYKLVAYSTSSVNNVTFSNVKKMILIK